MTYARFYFRRNTTAQPDAATLKTPTGWAWAMVRGVYSDGRTIIKNIDFVGAPGLATLTIPLTGQPSPTRAIYEVVLGMHDESPTDPKFIKAQQAHLWDQAVSLSKACMDEDPPPPPGLKGQFKVVSIT